MYFNKDEAARFLQALDPAARSWTFQVFDPTGNQGAAATWSGTLAEVGPKLVAANKNGLDVYVTVNETDGTGRKKANIKRARAVWQEDDGQGKELPLKPHIVVESSGNGHAHRYLRVNGDVPLDVAEGFNRRIATDWGGDPGAVDYSRVLRVPGFYNHKRKCPVRLVATSNDPPYHLEDLRRALGEPVVKKAKDPSQLPVAETDPPEDWFARLPDEVQKYFSGGELVHGNEDDHMLVKELYRIHLDAGWVWDTLVQNVDRADKAFKYDSEDYRVRTLRAAFDELVPFDVEEEMTPPGTLAEGDWGFLGGDGRLGERLKTKPPERKWLAKQRLIMGRAHIITGVGGSSKSTWTYQVAIGVVIGRLLWGWDLDRTGTVAMLMTEDCVEDAWETVWDICSIMEVTDEERALLGERLRIWTMAGREVELLSVDKAGVIKVNERGRQFIQALQRLDDLVLFVIDPALAITEGDENTQKHQRFLGTYVDKAAIETGACGLLVSHSTKASIRTDEIGSHQSRGGGALTDAVRGEYVLRTMTEKEAKAYGIVGEEEIKSHVQLKATKGNKIPPAAFAGMWLYRGHGGVLEEVSLTLVEDGVQQVGITASEQQALGILSRCPDGLTREDWKERLLGAGVLDKAAKPGTTRMKFKRMLDTLLEYERIEFDEESNTYRAVAA